MTEATTPLSFSTWRKIAEATRRPRKDPMIWANLDIEAVSPLKRGCARPWRPAGPGEHR